MAQTPENRDKAKIQKWLLAEFPTAFGFKYPAGFFGQSGIPDLIYCISGLFVAIEVKTAKGRVTKLQMERLKEIQKSNGIAMLIYGYDIAKLEKLKAIIERHLKH